MIMDAVNFNTAHPVVGIDVYQNGTVKVVRGNELQGDYGGHDHTRGEIKMLTSKSRARLALTVLECPYELESMITLTYAPLLPVTGKETKRHLDKFLRRMKVVFGGYQYVWFMEFSKAGGIHFHILTTFGEPDEHARDAMASIWCDCRDLPEWKYSSIKTRREHALVYAVWEVHRHKKAWEKIRKKDGAKRYALKYALKTYQKVVPPMYRDIGRFWGASRAVSAVTPKRVKMDEKTLRFFVDQHCPRLKDADILPEIIFNCFT